MQIERTESPIGGITLVFESGTLYKLDFTDCEERMRLPANLREGKSGSIRREIDVYFEGDLEAITRIPVQTGGTPFQRKVWQALTAIRSGQTKTYSQIAASIEHPKAIRAVGAANGANPISIVVPCHRLVGADGSLTGYGGGLERKKWLLNHELKASPVAAVNRTPLAW